MSKLRLSKLVLCCGAALPVAYGIHFGIIQAIDRGDSLYTEFHEADNAVWSAGGFLLMAGGQSAAPRFSAYDVYGIKLEALQLDINGARQLNVLSGRYSRSDDGFWAIAGSAYSGSDTASMFLALITPGAKTKTVIRTSPFVPSIVLCTPDGKIWTVGQTIDHGEPSASEQFVIRRFDRSGRLVGSALSRVGPTAVSRAISRSHLVASRDRVGWYSPQEGQYVEFSLNGDQIGQYTMPEANVETLALCGDNSLWATVRTSQSDKKSRRIVPLERSGSGIRVLAPLANRGYLYGCDGLRTLIVSSQAARSVFTRVPTT